MVQVHLITSHLLSPRTFAGGCVIHILTQHDQGYRWHLSYSLSKQIKKKKKKKINSFYGAGTPHHIPSPESKNVCRRMYDTYSDSA